MDATFRARSSSIIGQICSIGDRSEEQAGKVTMIYNDLRRKIEHVIMHSHVKTWPEISPECEIGEQASQSQGYSVAWLVKAL